MARCKGETEWLAIWRKGRRESVFSCREGRKDGAKQGRKEGRVSSNLQGRKSSRKGRMSFCCLKGGTEGRMLLAIWKKRQKDGSKEKRDGGRVVSCLEEECC